MQRRAVIIGGLVFGMAVTLSPAVSAAGGTVLEVSGAISEPESGASLALDLNALRDLGTVDIVTSTLWTDGVHRFTGVPLHVLLDHIGASGTRIEASAINDYTVSIPVSDAVPGGPIAAFEMDGKPMSRRDKGPLWIIYPYDKSAAYRTETVYSRSIWQLNRIHVTD